MKTRPSAVPETRIRIFVDITYSIAPLLMENPTHEYVSIPHQRENPSMDQIIYSDEASIQNLC